MERAPGIQQRVLVPVIVALLPALVVLLAVGVAEWQSELDAIETRQRLVARIAAEREDALASDARRLTAALTPQDCQRTLDRLIASYDQFPGAGVLDAQGQPVCQVGPSPGAVEQGAAWRRIQAGAGFGVADFGTAGDAIVFLHAIEEDGWQGVAYAMVDPPVIAAALDDDVLGNTEVVMTDASGRILGATGPWQGAAGFWIYPRPAIVDAMVQDGPAQLQAPGLLGDVSWSWTHWVLAGSEDAPLHLAIAVDPSASIQAANTVMAFNLSGAVALVALTGTVAAVAVNRYVSRPIRHLADQAAAARPDDPISEPPRSSGVHEIDTLTGTLHDARIRIHKELDARARQHEELERSNRELAEFAFVASHDLQEPIRKVVSFNELLQDHASGLDEDGQMLRERSLANARRGQALIKELLDFSRIDRPDLVRDVDCGAVVRELLADLPGGERVQVGSLPTVQASPVQVRQVWQNLIENALKYTDGAVEVGHDTTCFVRDHGPGIAPEFRDKAFQMFQRLHGKDVPGTGIGLAAVKKIVERHGGRIWIDDTPGGGATFRFTMETP